MKLNPRNAVLYGAGALLAALVVWGFALVGTPAKSRAKLEDKQAITALSCMACFAQQYACDHDGAFPESEQALVDYMKGSLSGGKYCNVEGLYCNNWQLAPKENYEHFQYKVDGITSYAVCGDMHAPANDGVYTDDGILAEFKDYKSGNQCFTFKPRACPKKLKRPE